MRFTVYVHRMRAMLLDILQILKFSQEIRPVLWHWEQAMVSIELWFGEAMLCATVKPCIF